MEKILSSAGFARNDRLSGFLRFVVEQELSGRGDDLKESVIGVEYFGRQPNYDVRQDSVVRNEAGRLRARLAEYYVAEGAADGLIIDLPKGGYKPGCRRVQCAFSSFAGGFRVEQVQRHTSAPDVHVRDTQRLEVGVGRGRRDECPGRSSVVCARPIGRPRLPPDAVLARELAHVGLVDGHGGDAEATRCRSPTAPREIGEARCTTSGRNSARARSTAASGRPSENDRYPGRPRERTRTTGTVR